VVNFQPDIRAKRGARRAIATEVEPRTSTDALRRPVTRRNFIVWYLAGLLTATVLAMIAPILVFIYPPQSAARKKDLSVTLDKAPADLQDGSAVRFDAPVESGFVMADGGGDNAPGKIAFAGFLVKEASGALNVFAVNCSHLGCSINFVTSPVHFACPCHGSQFSVGGQVTHGPALYPLSRLTWKMGGQPNQIAISGVELKGIG
jgi:Rieske Fe-S protein